ncbi:serine/threonine-protein kinase [Nocardia sp. NPDC059177]|uniref:serine/threonine-protein kinase n=1 Tax=Nocardia sp. NPDC059177 TaxID=3346759 RepID=UPI0036C1828A
MGVGNDVASFAGYTIESVLGQGGMGTVYLARHPRLPRRVALKLLNREVSADTEIRRRFEQEGDVVARLDHPGIVGVYDRGTTDGHLWIAMQYIQGSDVAKLDPGAITVERAMQIITQTAAALDHAHAHGVLHRDVKPANILLAQQESGRAERAVLTDFGIARLVDSSTQLTATGTFSATLAYASPEQLSAEVVDHRSDQYSLACTLFTLLANRTPFENSNPGQVVAGHLSLPVPRLSALRADLPPALDDVFARALAKYRDDRFGSCADFADAAAAALRGVAPAHPRSAPTVFRQEPESGFPQPHSSPPQPHYPPPPQQHLYRPGGLAPAPHLPAPRRTSWALRILAGAGVMLVAAIVLGYVQRDALIEGISGWDDNHQDIAEAFPELFPSSTMRAGWLGTDCYGSSYQDGKVYGIRCDEKDSGIEFQVKKYSSEAEATAAVALFVEDRSGDQVVTHPELSTQVTVSMEPATGLAADATVFTRFPGDPQRANLVFELKWNNHSAQETYQQRWPQAPLGKG